MDHVFPSSWYPESTPGTVQRWTAPSCQPCNGKFGEMEKEIFVRMAMCIDPGKPAAAGLWARAKVWLGIGVTGISDEEMGHRIALRKKVFADSMPLSVNSDLQHVLPGLGPHPEAPLKDQLQVSIPEEMVAAVAMKIVRGCEYWFTNGRIIEPPYEIDLVHAIPANLPPSVTQLIDAFSGTDLGTGLRMRRGGACDELGTAMYEIVVWDSWTFYAVILPPETA